ncbi:MAG: hypothetical protein R2830_25825 [Saprospiraceae bacterium]
MVKTATSHHFALLCVILPLLFGCNTARHAWYKKEEQNWQQRELPTDIPLRNTLFLVGSTDEIKPEKPSPTLSLLKDELAGAGEKSTLVFLGDNIPAFNLSSEKSMDKAEAHLQNLLGLTEGFKGKTYFMAGEKDWNNGKTDGRDAVRWQEDYVEDRLGGKTFMPGKGCGEPEKEKLHDDLRLLFIDSQWWLEDWEKVNGINRKCDISDRLAMLQEVEDVLKKYDKERVILFMHHPIYSNGLHGGSFSWKHHLFPLTLWNKNAWLPLPGLGTLAVLARQMGASRQDATHFRYQRMKQELLKIAEKTPKNQSLIFVGAHEHSLQYFEDPNKRMQFVVSGSAGKADFARGGRRANFVHAKQGYAKLYVYENNEVWLEFVTPGKEGGSGQVCFRKKLFTGQLAGSDMPSSYDFEPLPDSMTATASEAFAVGGIRKFTFGDRYRKAWETPVKVPVFNLNTTFKSLTPVQQGGGMSSKSLRLEGPDGKQYVLRSIEKDVSRGLPVDIRKTVVQDFIQDLKSGLHPYGAFVIPAMADAAGVYHTNPRLFYLPRQPRLGIYNDNFAGELYLFEERPNDDWNDEPNLGSSPNIKSYLSMLEDIHKSPKYRVDEAWALKSRLFDQFIHDADRHDDQWRWATIPQGDSLSLYRPIPRDRDQAFFDLRGVVPFVISRRFLQLQQRSFRGKIYDVPGQAYPGSVFDRSFITGLDKDEWMAVALKMQAALTDSVIENAFKAWPPEIYRLNAPYMITTLKERRDRIPIHAEKLYCYYAKYVDVIGTDKKDFFEVKHQDAGTTEVSVFSLTKEGGKGTRNYHRVFKKSETREVRLYGLGDDDLFLISGDGGRAVRVRIIGGEGEDTVEDNVETGGFFKKTAVYDTPAGMGVSGNVRELRSNRLKVNEYDRHEFKRSRYFPLVTFGRTVDDGFLFGGGVTLTNYRFRKEPYGVKHNIFARFSANTNALNLHYTGDFIRTVGTLDFNPDLRFDRPIIFNFFGLGNESLDTAQSSRYNWVRLEKLAISPLLKKSWYNGRNFTRFGPFFERVEAKTQSGHISSSDVLTQNELAEKTILGFTIQHSFQSVEGGSYPRNGLRFNLGATYYHNLSDNQGYTRLEGSFTTYVTVGSTVELTLASRIGAATMGNENFLFYHSNNLGGNAYLRGFRNNRFAGQSLFYHNTDLRLKLFYWRNHFMPFEFGLSGGFDYGRVWLEGEDSDKWHAGYSPGVWFTPYKFTAVTAFYTFTNGQEGDTYTIRVGFFF